MRKRAVKNPPNANRTVRQITTAALGRRYSMHFQKSSFMDFFSSIMQIRPLKSQAKPSAPAGCAGRVPVSFCRINERFYGLIIAHKNKFTSISYMPVCRFLLRFFGNMPKNKGNLCEINRNFCGFPFIEIYGNLTPAKKSAPVAQRRATEGKHPGRDGG